MRDASRAITTLEDLAEDNEVVSAILSDLSQVSENKESIRGWASLLSRDQRNKQLYRTALAFAVNFNSQMTGANAVTCYAKTIFAESLHFAERTATILSASILTWKILVCIIPLLIVDRFGRKPLFIISGFGMCVAMTGLAATVSHIDNATAAKAACSFFSSTWASFQSVT